MATSWRVGRHILVAASFFAFGPSPRTGAEEAKDAGPIPPIFSHTVTERAAPSPVAGALAAPAPNRGSTPSMLELISEGLPRFDPKLADSDADHAGGLSSLELSVPVVMEPFTVFEARVLDLEKPHENLLGRINGTEPLYRHIGGNLTSELTFVDLAKAYNWKPFSIEPPPAATLRFTVSW